MEKIFDKIREELDKKENIREQLIINSRPILKNSKQAIYALHRDSFKESERLLSEAKKQISQFRKLDTDNSSFGAALQEYAEAALYLNYVKNKKLASPQEIELDVENYLLGLCDLTGELSRRAVFCVVAEKYDEVKEIAEFVSEIYKEFLKFELRNGELRKKSDSIKWNLKKIEEILYDLKIRGKI